MTKSHLNAKLNYRRTQSAVALHNIENLHESRVVETVFTISRYIFQRGEIFRK